MSPFDPRLLSVVRYFLTHSEGTAGEMAGHQAGEAERARIQGHLDALAFIGILEPHRHKFRLPDSTSSAWVLRSLEQFHLSGNSVIGQVRAPATGQTWVEVLRHIERRRRSLSEPHDRPFRTGNVVLALIVGLHDNKRYVLLEQRRLEGHDWFNPTFALMRNL